MSTGWQPSTAEFRAVARSKGLTVCVALVDEGMAKEGDFACLDAATEHRRPDGLHTTGIYVSQLWNLEVQVQGASIVRFW